MPPSPEKPNPPPLTITENNPPVPVSPSEIQKIEKTGLQQTPAAVGNLKKIEISLKPNIPNWNQFEKRSDLEGFAPNSFQKISVLKAEIIAPDGTVLGKLSKGDIVKISSRPRGGSIGETFYVSIQYPPLEPGEDAMYEQLAWIEVNAIVAGGVKYSQNESISFE